MELKAGKWRGLRWGLMALCLLLGMLGAAEPGGDATAPAVMPRPLSPTSPTSMPGLMATSGGVGGVGVSPLAQLLPIGARVAVIRVEGLIYDFTLESLRRRVDAAVAEGASVLVIELDTPGGLVDSAMRISRYIKSLPMPTIAWVNNQAYSAGIMIASACQYMVMAPASATGDCAPIVPGTSLSPTERQKQLAPILTEFRDSATRNGYDYAIFEAMCELGAEVYEVRHAETGRVRFVNQADYAVMVLGKAMDAVSPPMPVAATQEASWMAPVGPTPHAATPADQGRWELSRKVHFGQSLLTLTQTEAMQLGLSRAIVSDDADLGRQMQAAAVVRYPQMGIEAVAYWLTRPLVRAVLFFLALTLGYMELQAPGITVFGALAGVALAALIGAPFLIDMARLWHVLLFAVGLAMLLVEVFVTPGFGLLGAAGIAAMFAGLVLMAVPTVGGFALPNRAMSQQLQTSFAWMLLGLIVSLGALVLLTRHFGQLPGFNRLILGGQAPHAPPGGSVTRVLTEPLPISGDEVLGAGTIRVGDVGQAVTVLRPAGRARFGELGVDVVTHGDWIEPGQGVRVVEVAGNVIVVESASASGQA